MLLVQLQLLVLQQPQLQLAPLQLLHRLVMLLRLPVQRLHQLLQLQRQPLQHLLQQLTQHHQQLQQPPVQLQRQLQHLLFLTELLTVGLTNAFNYHY